MLKQWMEPEPCTSLCSRMREDTLSAPVEGQIQDAQTGQAVQRRQVGDLVVLQMQRLQMRQPRQLRQLAQPA